MNLKQRKIKAIHSSLLHAAILVVLFYFELFSIQSINDK